MHVCPCPGQPGPSGLRSPGPSRSQPARLSKAPAQGSGAAALGADSKVAGSDFPVPQNEASYSRVNPPGRGGIPVLSSAVRLALGNQEGKHVCVCSVSTCAHKPRYIRPYRPRYTAGTPLLSVESVFYCFIKPA